MSEVNANPKKGRLGKKYQMSEKGQDFKWDKEHFLYRKKIQGIMNFYVSKVFCPELKKTKLVINIGKKSWLGHLKTPLFKNSIQTKTSGKF